LKHDYYILVTWLDSLVYGTCCLVQVGAWLMHVFMVQVEVQVDAWLMHGSGLLVQVYNGISHIDSVKVFPSFYFYLREVGQGMDKWL
jgi:hypothetical protein